MSDAKDGFFKAIAGVVNQVRSLERSIDRCGSVRSDDTADGPDRRFVSPFA